MTPKTDIEDDLALLDLILADTEAAPAEFKPTNFWSNNLPPIVREFRTEGLRRFRARRSSRMGSFGASDLRPQWRYFGMWAFENAFARRFRTVREAAVSAEQLVNKWVLERGIKVRGPYGLTAADLKEAAFEAAEREARLLGKLPLSAIDASTAGDPEDVFVQSGKTYTWNLITYYLRYLFAAQHVDFERQRVVVELGPGGGTSVEVLKKLHPHLTFVLFDIPPALYVSHQYLRAVFGDRVVPYRETRTMSALDRLEPGRIYVFGSWKFPLLASMRDYVFWNAASLQEMEPEIAANYLRYVDDGASAVYLNELMAGQFQARGRGQHGVLEQTVFAHYEAALRNFRLVARQRARLPIGFLVEHGPYEETVWIRK